MTPPNCSNSPATLQNRGLSVVARGSLGTPRALPEDLRSQTTFVTTPRRQRARSHSPSHARARGPFRGCETRSSRAPEGGSRRGSSRLGLSRLEGDARDCERCACKATPLFPRVRLGKRSFSFIKKHVTVLTRGEFFTCLLSAESLMPEVQTLLTHIDGSSGSSGIRKHVKSSRDPEVWKTPPRVFSEGRFGTGTLRSGLAVRKYEKRDKTVSNCKTHSGTARAEERTP